MLMSPSGCGCESICQTRHKIIRGLTYNRDTPMLFAWLWMNPPFVKVLILVGTALTFGTIPFTTLIWQGKFCFLLLRQKQYWHLLVYWFPFCAHLFVTVNGNKQVHIIYYSIKCLKLTVSPAGFVNVRLNIFFTIYFVQCFHVNFRYLVSTTHKSV